MIWYRTDRKTIEIQTYSVAKVTEKTVVGASGFIHPKRSRYADYHETLAEAIECVLVQEKERLKAAEERVEGHRANVSTLELRLASTKFPPTPGAGEGE